MLLQLVVESMIREAASGACSMVALFDEIYAKVIPTQEKQLPPPRQHCRWKSSSKKKLATPTRKIDNLR